MNIVVVSVTQDYKNQDKNVSLLGHSSIAYLISRYDRSVKARRFNLECNYILGVDSSTGGVKVTVGEVKAWLEQGHTVSWHLNNTNLKGELSIFSQNEIDLMYKHYPEIKEREDLRNQQREASHEKRKASHQKVFSRNNEIKVYGVSSGVCNP